MRTFPVPPRVLLALSVVVSTLSIPTTASSVPVVRTPDAPRSVVDLRSDPAGRVWRGSMQLSFRNAASDPLDRVFLRLWSNGVAGCGPLAIEIDDLSGGTPGVLTKRCTSLRVDLDQPLAQGERGSLAFDLTIRVPIRNDRFGHWRGLSMLGSALPILAVHDDAGWNLPPFVDIGESYYSVVGSYRVTLDTPRDIATVATGERVFDAVGARRHVSRFVADDVRDFEWAAGPLRHVVDRSAGARVLVSYLPDATTRDTARRMLRHAVVSMRTFARSFGRYPYPEVDVVLTGFATFGGMEYPTLVFSNANRYTVAHELAHQWWYGIVGDDQFSEPWIDEGLASWSQSLPWDPSVGCRGIRWPSPSAAMTNDMGYWRGSDGEYGFVVYHGARCLFSQLAEGFGLARFLRILERLVDRYRFGVIRTEDLVRTIDRAADRHWPGFPDDFWDRWRVEP